MPQRSDDGSASRAPRRARRGYEPTTTEASSDHVPKHASRASGTYGGPTTTPVDRVATERGRGRPSSAAAGATATVAAASRQRRFRKTVLRTIAGTIIPGLGMIGTRAHWLGITIVTALVVALTAIGVAFARNPLLTAGGALQSDRMYTLAVVLGVLAAVWTFIIIGTYLVSRPRQLNQTQRALGAGLVGVLSLLVSAPLAVGSAYSLETALLSGGLFDSQDDSKSQTRPTLDQRDPWADKDRVNLLLLGGDSGEGRDEDLGVRTDTMMLVSIDTASGATLIIQLPRNLQGAPFPAGSPLARAFPYGFNNGSSSMLNAVWNDVPNMHPELFGDTDYPGADALKWAVEGVTDLKIDYFVMVNIDGLVNLIDAMGGVWLNVNHPIAIGGSDEGWNCGEGGWIPEGPGQHMWGYDAMWYARSRCNSPNGDFDRMQRQSCLVKAVIDQADPAKMATRYEDIAKAAGNMVSTDIPQEHLSAMVDLSGRVQKAQLVQRITYIEGENGYYSAYPDFELMHQQIAAAISELTPSDQAPPTDQAPDDPATAPVEPTEPPTAEAPAGTDAPQPSASGPAEDVADACAYRHELPAGNVQVPSTVPVYTPEATDPAKPR